METHAGTTINARRERTPRPHRLTQLRARLRQRRLQRAERAYSMRKSGSSAPAVSGSEHTHLLHKGS
jgi:hypothetical protein